MHAARSRALLASLVAIVAVGALGACAATPELPDHPQGRALGPGMRSFELVRGEASESVLQPWEPAPYHPGLATRRPAPSRHDARPAGAPAPLASRGFGAASGWVFFQLYQNTWSRADGATCRFHPSCSRFGLEAVGDHGLTGLMMTFGRLQRNHQDTDWYPPHEQTQRLADPLEGYSFFLGRPSLDDFARFSDPAHGWLMHVRAVEAMGAEGD